MRNLEIKVSIIGTLDETDRRAFARHLGMEGEPVAEIKAEMADVIADEAWRMLADIVETEGY